MHILNAANNIKTPSIIRVISSIFDWRKLTFCSFPVITFSGVAVLNVVKLCVFSSIMVTGDCSKCIVFGIFRREHVIGVFAGTDTNVVCSILRIIDLASRCTGMPFRDGIICLIGLIVV